MNTLYVIIAAALLSTLPLCAMDKDLNAELLTACGYARLDIAEGLIMRGAQIDTIHDVGRTPLIEAATFDSTNIAALLIRQKADVDYGEDQTPLHIAAVCNSHGVARLLLEHQADANHIDRRGNTPIFAAARYGDSAMVALLLQNKADVQCKNEDGHTIRQFIVRCPDIPQTGRQALLQLLDKHEAQQKRESAGDKKQ